MLANHRPPRGHEAGIAREYTARQTLVGFDEMASNTVGFVCIDHLPVLSHRLLLVETHPRPVLSAEGHGGYRIQGHPAKVVRLSQQDIGQYARLGFDTPTNLISRTGRADGVRGAVVRAVHAGSPCSTTALSPGFSDESLVESGKTRTLWATSTKLPVGIQSPRMYAVTTVVSRPPKEEMGLTGAQRTGFGGWSAPDRA